MQFTVVGGAGQGLLGARVGLYSGVPQFFKLPLNMNVRVTRGEVKGSEAVFSHSTKRAE